MVKI
jgi:hypothetical protein